MEEVTSIGEIGPTLPQRPDGTCGYKGLIEVLYRHGKLEPTIALTNPGHDYSKADRQEDLIGHKKCENIIRYGIAMHWRHNYRRFRGDKDHTIAAKNADGNSMAVFKGKQLKKLIANIQDTIYRADENFRNGCESELWANRAITFPIAAHKYQHTISIYTKGSKRTRSTYTYHYDSDVDCVTCHIAEGAYLTPPDNAMCLVHNGRDHYDAINVSRVSCDQVYLALRRFGFVGGRTKDSEPSNIEGAAAVSEDDICNAKKGYLRLLKWGDQQRIDEASKFVDLVSDSDPEDSAYIDSPTRPKKRRHRNNNNIKATKTTALAMDLSSPSKAKLTKTCSYRDLATFKSDQMDKDGSLLVNYHPTGDLTVKVRASKVREMLTFNMNGPELADIEYVEGLNKGAKSAWYDDAMKPSYPPQFSASYGNCKLHQVPRNDGSKRCGKQPKYGLIWHFMGKCGMHTRGCPTKFHGGMDISQLKLVAEGVVGEVEMKMMFTGGGCVHPQYVESGRLSRSDRISEREEVS